MTINTWNYIYSDRAVQGKFTANTTQKYYLEWGLDDVLSSQVINYSCIKQLLHHESLGSVQIGVYASIISVVLSPSAVCFCSLHVGNNRVGHAFPFRLGKDCPKFRFNKLTANYAKRLGRG